MNAPRIIPLALLLALIPASSLHAQATGTVTGRVLDGATLTPIGGATVTVVGTARGTITQAGGNYIITGVPTGTQRVRVEMLGYATQEEEVTVTEGATVTIQFSLTTQAVELENIIVTGYGSQRREAITGSVAQLDAEEANVGLVANANELIQGRVAGVRIALNNGEPGAGQQVRIRGGTSISASNEPLYVIDGVPVQNVNTEPGGGIDIGGAPSLPRSPLNLINPSDIESITILKDASAAAIYGSRAANGVVLIETKKGQRGALSFEYNGYVSMSSPARYLDLLDGNQYRSFIQNSPAVPDSIRANLASDLGSANTDWERELTQSAISHNHDLSFAGGTERTRYRASLNYQDQQGVALSSGMKRVQGRLNAVHRAFNDRLRLNLNLTSSHIDHDYLAYETGGGFEGGVFINMVNFNPTNPVTVVDPGTGLTTYYEVPNQTSVRNPVALARQIDDESGTTRTLGNVSADLELIPGLTGRVNVGVDRSESVRREYVPRTNPAGAQWNGRARQEQLENTGITLQTLLTLNRPIGTAHHVEVVGGYEYNDYERAGFGAEGQDFVTDAFNFNNLGGGANLVRPFSWREDSRLVSFFSRANYSLMDRYFLTGVVRYDGSSRFGEGNKWGLFPAISASWRLSEEAFLLDGPFSDLRLRVGYGLQGNEAVPAYASLLRLETDAGAAYGFGDQTVVGVAPVSNRNPDLKWEETAQFNVAVDYGFVDNRYSGSLEFYVKNTTDLLLEVVVPQPAPAERRIENVGEVRNRGVEFSLDAVLLDGDGPSWNAGLVFAADRNEVIDLGPYQFITSGFVSGQGQTGQTSLRIMPGEPIGTFFGPEFVRVCGSGESGCTAGQQLFNDYDANGNVVGLITSGSLTGDDFVKIGDANPDFSLGLRNALSWGDFDASVFLRSEIGQDVFNNTALVYQTKSNALQGKNFLADAVNDPDDIYEPAVFSSRWIEDGSFLRVDNVTLGYTLNEIPFVGGAQRARLYLSGDNLLLFTGYSGYDPEVHSTNGGLGVRGIDYLAYPRGRTITAGVQMAF
jgi:TonB-linked SusC/RagA family outer membrane protein